MKQAIPVISFIYIALISFSCENVVYTEPQPAQTQAEEKFPEAWQGLFKNVGVSKEDGFSDSWVKVWDKEIVLFNSRMDSVPFLEGGDYEAGANPMIGDSIQVMLRGEMVDAVFAESGWAKYTVTNIEKLGLSDTLVLKLLSTKGFLNMPDEQHGEDYWNGVLIEPIRNGDLLLWTIEDGEQEAENMKPYFTIEEIENPGYAGILRIASPQKKEFISYVNSGGFPDLFLWLSKDFTQEEVPADFR